MTPLLRRAPSLRRWLPLAVVVLLATGLWSATSSSAATAAVDIMNFAFDPPEVTVRVGDTVTWTNHDSEPHAVQGDGFDSPDIPAGGTYSRTFTTAGDVPYLCRIHTYMTGVVHVTTDAPATTTTTAPPATTTTTTPDPDPDPDPDPSTTTTTAPPSTGSAPFQEVPDDPSATHPPGSPGAEAPPPATAPQPTTTTTAPPPSSPGEQEVPDDPSAGHPPGHPTVQAASASEGAPDAGTPLGDGTYLAPSTEEDGRKVFELRMAPTTIETAPGVTKQAYAFNGVVPGPVLRVNEGDDVRIVVVNDLAFPTSVHWHGMILPNDQDGVGGITQPDIPPGGRYVYEWTAEAPGTHWYHTHSSGRHIGKGLYGALEVVPRLGDIDADRDYRVMLGDTDLGFVLNGRSFPSTPTLPAKVGEKVHLRVVNAGDQVHAMHLHGVPFDVVAQDGNPLPAPLRMDTLGVAPAQTFDLVFTPRNEGPWLFHCHVFAHSHMSGDTHPPGDSGMTGMVLVVNVVPSGSPLPATTGLPARSVPIGATSAPDGGVPLPVAFGLAALAAVALRTGRRRLSTPHHPRKDQTR